MTEVLERPSAARPIVYTYQVEQWSGVWREASAMWAAHWNEVGTDRDRMELDPDMDTLAAMEKAGQLHIVTVRRNGELVGYHASVVRPHLHYRRSLCAFTDLYFVLPECRVGSVGIKLFREAERTLKARGVVKVVTGTKMSLDRGRVLERLGYHEFERLYSKWVGD